MSKQDRQGVRTVSALEQKYNFGAEFGDTEERFKSMDSKIESANKSTSRIAEALQAHSGSSEIHVTSAEREAWDSKAEAEHVHTVEEIEDFPEITLTAVKGSAENEFRTGNVNIAPEHLGISVINNTADGDKSVKYAASAGSATKATQDGNGNVITSTYKTKAESVNVRISSTPLTDENTVRIW